MTNNALMNSCHLEPGLFYEIWMMALERHSFLQARNSLLRYVWDVLYVGQLTQALPPSALAIHLLPFLSFRADRRRLFKADVAVTFDLCPSSLFCWLCPEGAWSKNSPFLPICPHGLGSCWNSPGVEGKKWPFLLLYILVSTILTGI